MWQVLDNIERSPIIRVSDHGIAAVVLQAVANVNNSPSRLTGSHSVPNAKGTAFNYPEAHVTEWKSFSVAWGRWRGRSQSLLYLQIFRYYGVPLELSDTGCGIIDMLLADCMRCRTGLVKPLVCKFRWS
jgi:hypothetical protein